MFTRQAISINRETMKQKTNRFIFILFVILTVVSCESPICSNKNPVFDKYNINSFEYKTELLKQIEKSDKRIYHIGLKVILKKMRGNILLSTYRIIHYAQKEKLWLRTGIKLKELKGLVGKVTLG